MTSSEHAALAEGTIERFAGRVGTSRAGQAGGGTARIAVVCSKFNGAVTARLLDGVLDALDACGVDPATVTVAWVPGAFEIPLAAQRVIASRQVDAVVGLGAVIRGDTAHFDFVAGPCAQGLQRVALDTGVPVVFGVLTTDTLAQALERCRDDRSNKGYEAAMTALEMVDLLGPVGRDGG
jgi:6,7-dimethyl-8-ribityllumazine synthase